MLLRFNNEYSLVSERRDALQLIFHSINAYMRGNIEKFSQYIYIIKKSTQNPNRFYFLRSNSLESVHDFRVSVESEKNLRHPSAFNMSSTATSPTRLI